eukprot:6548769-Pyramimonas_sp.AAC.1
MPGNTYPGEEGRVAEVAKGNLPPRSQEFKMVQRTANGEAWLAFQLLQKSTKTPPGTKLCDSELGTLLQGQSRPVEGRPSSHCC